MMLSWKFIFGPNCATLHWWQNQNMTRLLTWKVNKDWWSRSNFLTAMTSSELTNIIWWQLCTELLWEMPGNTNSTWDFLTNKLKENDYLRKPKTFWEKWTKIMCVIKSRKLASYKNDIKAACSFGIFGKKKVFLQFWNKLNQMSSCPEFQEQDFKL